MTENSGFMTGGGDMGAMMRAHDWSASSLGDPETWPESLRTSLSIMLNSSFPMFVWWDEKSLINFYNDEYKVILGNKHPDALGQSAKKVWTEIWSDIEPLKKQVFTDGTPVYMKDLRLMLNRYGYEEEAYFTFSYGPIREDDGKIGGLFCVVNETTEEVLNHQKLEESDNRFRSLADTAPMYIAMADETGNAVYFNQPWLEYTGKKLEDMKGMGWLSTLHPDDAPTFENDFKKAFSEHIAINKEYRFRRADGEYRWMLAIGAPRFTPKGNFIGYFGTYTDFHELKEAQIAVQQREEQFRALADNIPNLAWMARADGHIYWYNSRWYEYTGKSPAQMEGWGWQSVHDPNELPGVLAKWKNSIKSGRGFEMVFPLRGADGSFRPFLTRVVPLRSKDGVIEQWIGTNTDISQQIKIKHAEARTEELEGIAAQLARQQKDLIELNKAKDEFISLASHQLRTPATGVKQYVGMLIEGYAGELSIQQKLFAERAYESNEREISIVNDLLKVAQVDAGKMHIRKKKIDFVALIQEVIDEQRGKFAEQNQSIIFKKFTETIVANADEERMRMVIENLVDNASKYTPPYKTITVDVSVVKEGKLRIKIQDEGVGISASDKKKIFEKFVRIDNPLSDVVGGSGLGLYLVKRIVDLHDGSIEVSSTPKKGSVFTITLPV